MNDSSANDSPDRYDLCDLGRNVTLLWVTSIYDWRTDSGNLLSASYFMYYDVLAECRCWQERFVS